MKQLALRMIMCATIIALLMTACTSRNPTSSTPTPLSHVIAGEMVDVGGRELFYKCNGEGSPTVILEAGGDSDSAYWDLVMAYFGGTSRICSYDRANLGSSASAPKPRSPQDMVSDLHALLVNAHIDGPYILVGHSGGGLIVRAFADQYPGDVVGIVLVDAAHPEMGSRLLSGLPPESVDEPKILNAYRQWFTWMANSSKSSYQDKEGWDTRAVMEQVKAAITLGDLPLVVISRSPDNAPLAEGMPPMSAETNARLMQIWQGMQSELVGLSSNSTQVFAQGGHMIPKDEPKLIVDALTKLVNEYRDLIGETLVGKNMVSPALTAGQLEEAHAPRILRVVEQQERKDGRLIFDENVYFTDEAGDAVVAEVSLTSGDLGEGQHVSGGVIEASADEQKREALLNATWVCYSQGIFVLEVRIVDQARNSSEPVILTFPCPAPTNFSLFLIIGLVAGIGVLAVVVWWLVCYRRARRALAILSG